MAEHLTTDTKDCASTFLPLRLRRHSITPLVITAANVLIVVLDNTKERGGSCRNRKSKHSLPSSAQVVIPSVA